MTSYTTKERVRDELISTTPTTAGQITLDASANQYIIDAIEEVSRRIDEIKDYGFEPFLETRYFDAYSQQIDVFADMLTLGHPLLEATEVIDSNATTLTEWDGTRGARETADYEPLEFGQSPFHFLRRLNASWAAPSAGFENAITVTGYWGFHKNYSRRGWVLSTDSIQDAAGITATATTVTVGDADGADGFNFSPRFSEGLLIRMESEFCRVVSVVAAATNELTIVRAENGTTAATHANAIPISIWYPDPAIRRITTRIVAQWTARRANFASAIFDGFAVTSFPADLPPEAINTLNAFSRLAGKRIRGV